MAISINESGSIMLTGDDIHVYRALALRHALSLEAKGLKMSRGMSALAAIKDLTGLSGTRTTMVPKYDKWLRERGIIE